jgi:AcrR family transcriptional regulator
VAAAREVLGEVGFAGATIQAISERAEVPASAIYRRWRSRIELIEEAVAPAPPRLGPPTGDLARDLARFERVFRRALTTPAGRAAVPALLAAYQAGQTGRPPEAWLRGSWRPLFRDVLRSAGPSAVDVTVDPDAVFDLLLGSILVQAFVPTAAPRPNAPGYTVELLCRMVAPR